MKNRFLIIFFILSAFVVNAQNKDVFDIARKGTVQEMKDLVKLKPDTINAVNSMGYTPLILACYRGNVEVAKFLMENAKDINYNSSMGTALMSVVYKGDLKMTQELIEHQADINKADAVGTTPLIFATKLGNVEMIKLLLKYKANKALKDNEGKTAFEYAVFSKNQELINQLKN